MKTNWIKTVVVVAACTMWVGCEKAAETTGSAADAVKSAADATKDAGAQAADKAGEMAASLTGEAQKLLDQATAYVKEKKFDSAEPIIKKLEEMKTKLPAEWATKIEQARSAFDTAKKALQNMPAGLPVRPPRPRLNKIFSDRLWRYPRMGMLKDFRDFAMKGNVIDLAVGVIIGAAFGGIVNSLVTDVLMPPIGKIVGNLDFSNLYISLSSVVDDKNKALSDWMASTQPTTSEGMLGSAASMLGMSGRIPLEEARKLGPVVAYGKFLTALINLIIIAFCLFLVVKGLTTAQKKFEGEKASAPPPPPAADVVLLTEIRDILKDKQA